MVKGLELHANPTISLFLSFNGHISIPSHLHSSHYRVNGTSCPWFLSVNNNNQRRSLWINLHLSGFGWSVLSTRKSQRSKVNARSLHLSLTSRWQDEFVCSLHDVSTDLFARIFDKVFSCHFQYNFMPWMGSEWLSNDHRLVKATSISRQRV